MADTPTSKEHWFLVAEDVMRDTLIRARKGESPDSLLMELWSNSNHYDDDDLETPDEQSASEAGVATFSLTPEGDDT